MSVSGLATLTQKIISSVLHDNPSKPTQLEAAVIAGLTGYFSTLLHGGTKDTAERVLTNISENFVRIAKNQPNTKKAVNLVAKLVFGGAKGLSKEQIDEISNDVYSALSVYSFPEVLKGGADVNSEEAESFNKARKKKSEDAADYLSNMPKKNGEQYPKILEEINNILKPKEALEMLKSNGLIRDFSEAMLEGKKVFVFFPDEGSASFIVRPNQSTHKFQNDLYLRILGKKFPEEIGDLAGEYFPRFEVVSYDPSKNGIVRDLSSFPEEFRVIPYGNKIDEENLIKSFLDSKKFPEAEKKMVDLVNKIKVVETLNSVIDNAYYNEDLVRFDFPFEKLEDILKEEYAKLKPKLETDLDIDTLKILSKANFNKRFFNEFKKAMENGKVFPSSFYKSLHLGDIRDLLPKRSPFVRFYEIGEGNELLSAYEIEERAKAFLNEIEKEIKNTDVSVPSNIEKLLEKLKDRGISGEKFEHTMDVLKDLNLDIAGGIEDTLKNVSKEQEKLTPAKNALSFINKARQENGEPGITLDDFYEKYASGSQKNPLDSFSPVVQQYFTDPKFDVDSFFDKEGHFSEKGWRVFTGSKIPEKEQIDPSIFARDLSEEERSSLLNDPDFFRANVYGKKLEKLKQNAREQETREKDLDEAERKYYEYYEKYLSSSNSTEKEQMEKELLKLKADLAKAQKEVELHEQSLWETPIKPFLNKHSDWFMKQQIPEILQELTPEERESIFKKVDPKTQANVQKSLKELLETLPKEKRAAFLEKNGYARIPGTKDEWFSPQKFFSPYLKDGRVLSDFYDKGKITELGRKTMQLPSFFQMFGADAAKQYGWAPGDEKIPTYEEYLSRVKGPGDKQTNGDLPWYSRLGNWVKDNQYLLATLVHATPAIVETVKPVAKFLGDKALGIFYDKRGKEDFYDRMQEWWPSEERKNFGRAFDNVMDLAPALFQDYMSIAAKQDQMAIQQAQVQAKNDAMQKNYEMQKAYQDYIDKMNQEAVEMKRKQIDENYDYESRVLQHQADEMSRSNTVDRRNNMLKRLNYERLYNDSVAKDKLNRKNQDLAYDDMVDEANYRAKMERRQIGQQAIRNIGNIAEAAVTTYLNPATSAALYGLDAAKRAANLRKDQAVVRSLYYRNRPGRAAEDSSFRALQEAQQALFDADEIDYKRASMPSYGTQLANSKGLFSNLMDLGLNAYNYYNYEAAPIARKKEYISTVGPKEEQMEAFYQSSKNLGPRPKEMIADAIKGQQPSAYMKEFGPAQPGDMYSFTNTREATQRMRQRNREAEKEEEDRKKKEKDENNRIAQDFLGKYLDKLETKTKEHPQVTPVSSGTRTKGAVSMLPVGRDVSAQKKIQPRPIFNMVSQANPRIPPPLPPSPVREEPYDKMKKKMSKRIKIKIKEKEKKAPKRKRARLS